MTPQELKSSILQLAIQGKLVEQRPEEGTGEELYRQIQKKKQELIKAGTIKKEKPLPEISEDEIPFDIPESWKWIRLSEISKVITKGTTPCGGIVSYLQDGIGFLRAENVAGLDQLDKTDMKFIDEKTHTGFLARSILEVDDILITIAGTLGRTGLVRREDLPLNANQAVALIRLVDSSKVNLKYLVYSLNAASTQKALTAQKKVTAIPNLTLEIISLCAIPIPPLAEQERIATRVEEILPLIDHYEKAWNRLEDFNKRFPVDMQKSILQMAIQGKLVEQRPEEGTGEELYQQIQAEKQALMKEGKIKKEKPLAVISEDEIPFDIPETWMWIRLPVIADMCLGKMLDKQKNTGTPTVYLRNVNVRWGYFDLSDLLEMKFEDIHDERYLICKNDIVMCEGGEPGRCAVWTEDTAIHFQKALHRIRLSSGLSASFFYYVFCLYSNNGLLSSLFTGTTIKHLTGQSLEKVIVPLPPIAEQKRIVAKLEEILPLCEKLK